MHSLHSEELDAELADGPDASVTVRRSGATRGLFPFASGTPVHELIDCYDADVMVG